LEVLNQIQLLQPPSRDSLTAAFSDNSVALEETNTVINNKPVEAGDSSGLSLLAFGNIKDMEKLSDDTVSRDSLTAAFSDNSDRKLSDFRRVYERYV